MPDDRYCKLNVLRAEQGPGLRSGASSGHDGFGQGGRTGGLPLGGGGDAMRWLESPDDDRTGAIDGGRVLGFVVVAALLLAAIGGGTWWMLRATDGRADGSLIHAEAKPYKVRPDQPGGKTFAGTGDSSYAVSRGQTRGAALAASEALPGTATPMPGESEAAVAANDGVGVQLGAYMDAAAAEAGWAAIVLRNPSLSGVRHRVVESRGDIGNVHALQAVTGNLAAATELCRSLQQAGQGCRVKN